MRHYNLRICLSFSGFEQDHTPKKWPAFMIALQVKSLN
jgi:hypothetical protein